MITGNLKLDAIILLGGWLLAKLGINIRRDKLEQARDWVRTRVKRAFRVALELADRDKRVPAAKELVSEVLERVRDAAADEGIELPAALWTFLDTYARELVDDHLGRKLADALPRPRPGPPAPVSVSPIGIGRRR